MSSPPVRLALVMLLWLLGAASRALPQQAAPAAGEPLTITTQSLPRWAAHFPYDFPLHAEGGTPPLRWKVVSGALPPGVELDAERGRLRGAPSSAGEFYFALTVTDSSNPPYERTRSFVLKVVPPLEVVWKQMPKVAGDQIEGSVEISNNTPEEFDLTVIVVAVNEVGKAFALGYQHGPMRANTALMNVPFGSQMNLPRGRYVVHVDAVAEIPARQAIYRARLQTEGALQIP